MKWKTVSVVGLVALAGCSKIHESRSFTLEPADTNNIKVSAPIGEQKIKVTLTADNAVSVWVVLEKDVPSGKDEFDPELLGAALLASQKDATETTLTATIPAKESYRIVVNRATKKATVSVKIDSQ